MIYSNSAHTQVPAGDLWLLNTPNLQLLVGEGIFSGDKVEAFRGFLGCILTRDCKTSRILTVKSDGYKLFNTISSISYGLLGRVTAVLRP